MNTIKSFSTSFPSLILHALICFFEAKYFLSLFSKSLSNQTKHTPHSVPYGESRFPTKGTTGGLSSHVQNFELPCWIPTRTKRLSPASFLHISQCPSLDRRPHIGQKLSLIAFRQILQEICHSVGFQFNNHDLFGKIQ